MQSKHHQRLHPRLASSITALTICEPINVDGVMLLWRLPRWILPKALR